MDARTRAEVLRQEMREREYCRDEAGESKRGTVKAVGWELILRLEIVFIGRVGHGIRYVSGNWRRRPGQANPEW